VPPEQRGVGIVFQDYALFPHLTVEDNVGFGLHRLDRGPRRERIAQILELVGLPGFGARYPHELSGGQQQRVAVARALAPAPALILLDEPFSNLDADLRAQMRDEVENILRNTGTTAIFVTHDQEEAFTLADRVGVMHAGRIEQLASPEDIYHHPASQFVAEFVGAADFLPGLVTSEGIVTEVGVFGNVGDLEPGDAPWTEDESLKPSSPYAASKASADLLIGAWRRTFGTPVLLTRCGNNYGPYQFPEKLIPLVITRAMAGSPSCAASVCRVSAETSLPRIWISSRSITSWGRRRSAGPTSRSRSTRVPGMRPAARARAKFIRFSKAPVFTQASALSG